MASRYKQFMRLLNTWPAEPARGKRDLGGHIRNKVAAAFPRGETSDVPNQAECDQMLKSLQKLNSDFYRQKYERTVEQKGCTGLKPQQLKTIMTEKGMKEMGESQRGRFDKLMDYFTRKKT